MPILIQTIKKISFAMAFTLLFFSNAFASVPNSPINEHDSMYRYNSLENKNNFRSLANNVDIDSLEEKYSEDSEPSDDITKKLQDITEKQNYSMEKIENALNALENRNKVKTFLIGKNLGILRFQLVQIKDQAYLLDALLSKTEDNTVKLQINNQMGVLKEQQKRIENFILEQGNKFSLFGWFVKML